MVESVASMALETLRDLLIEEAKFLSSVDGEVDEVRRQLSTMHSLLKDADKREDTNNTETLRNWVKDLRDLAIRAEDVLQRYALEVSSKRQAKDLKSVMRRFACILGDCASVHTTGKEIEVIRSRMADLTKSLESISKNSSGGPSNTVDDIDNWLGRTYGLDEVQENFVGMEKDIKLLVSLLRSDGNDKPKRVISICGMGGLGKTTLATKIYNHDSVRSHFNARAWICISQKFNPKAVFQGLLQQLGVEEQIDEENLLVRKLNQVLEERKCLVVMDDIWEVDHWNILLHAFAAAASKGHSKVLLTSRNDRIVATESGSYVHNLALLSEDEGWDLLQKIALPRNSSSPGLTTLQYEAFKDHGKNIVRKCGRLPLAISVIGGILCEKKTPREWEKVKVNIDSYLKQGNGVSKQRRIERILDLSYNNLPYNLKPCFLFLGCFPEDSDIDSEKLYLLWMTEGMVSSGDRGRGETLRDVAERYLCELASRCMVQVKVSEFSVYKRFESCRLHDLMRDLCLSKGKEEEFLEVVDTQRQRAGITDIVSSIGRTHRLAFYIGGDVQFQQLGTGERNYTSLRSLLILPPQNHQFMVKEDSDGFGRFKFLRILSLERCNFMDGFPQEIKTLILLKHLSIEGSILRELPRFVCKLPCLQSLNLDVACRIRIPNVIHKISRLRHLVLPYSKFEIVGGGKLKLDGLSELETLHNLKSTKVDVSHLLKLPNLRCLSGLVLDEESLSVIVHHISDNQHKFWETDLGIIIDSPMNSEQVDTTIITKLLMCESLRKVAISCVIKRLPPVHEPHLGQNLVWLYLEVCEIEEDPMGTLGKLPVLRLLQLDPNSFVGTRMFCRAGGFPQLKCLRLSRLPELMEWTVDEKAMPLLSELSITGCVKLTMIPQGLRSITSLQRINIMGMPEEFNDRLRMVDGVASGEDYDKIKHVPTIRVDEY